MSLAEKLQTYRKEQSLSQEELAERLGVSRQSVSKWELGQAYPETAKLVELSRMMGVTVDELLKEEAADGAHTGAETPIGKRSRSKWPVIVICAVLAGALILVLNLTGRTGRDDLPSADPGAAEPAPAEAPTTVIPVSQPLTGPKMEDLQSCYFDFARTYRLDYIPFFEAGEAPMDAAEYLYFAFAINLDNWGEDKGTMTREYVEETALAYFGVTELTHRAVWKSWDYDGAVYTALPEGIKLPPVCRLVRYETHAQDGVQYHEVTLDFLLVEGEVAETMVEAGDLEGLPVLSRESFVYAESPLNFGRPYFISHCAADI